MDGTYGSPFQSSQPGMPSMPSTSAPNQYKANVRRNKTRKWVEAKVQNYDGDDWGNEYEDEEEEEEPPLPVKPQGPRPQMGSGAPPMPQGAGTSSALSFLPSGSPLASPGGGRSPSGPPALQIHTQQQQPGRTGTPETDSPWRTRRAVTGFPEFASEQRRSPPVGQSPASAGPAGPAGLPSSRVASPASFASAGRASPASSASGPVPARYPPRKSSMGQQDKPSEIVAGVQQQQPSQEGSGPESSHRPWVTEGQAAPPQGPRSPSTTTKPLPFVRPSDIYRRVDEEKEKERQSLDSGRPSMDSITGGRGGERVGSPSGGAGAEQGPSARRSSFGRDDAADSARGVRPGLATVAERTSEYALESYLNAAGLGDDEPSEDKKPVPELAPAIPAVSSGASGSVEQALPSQAAAAAQQQEPARQDAVTQEQPIRRFSTSPKLPDLTRMSGFGIDLFGGNSPSFSDHIESRSRAGDNTHVPIEAIPTPSPLSQPSPGAAILPVPSPSPGPQLGPSIGQLPPHQSQFPTASEHAMKLESKPAAAAAPAVESEKSSIPDSQGAQPTGDKASGWSAKSPAVVSPSREVAGSTHAADPAPVLGEPHGQTSSTDDAVRPTATHNMAPAASGSTTPSPTIITTEAGGASTGLSEPPDNGVASERSPHTLPPLNTHSTSPEPQNIKQAPVAGTAPPPQSFNTAAQEGRGSQPASATTPATAASEIPPTAPLNPNRGAVGTGTPSEDLDASGSSLARAPTMSTTATVSPVKESDMLREEIMKSLSPLRPAEEFPPPTRTATYGSELGVTKEPGASVPRESTYLGNVYDDYYGSAADDDSEKLEDVDKASPTTAKPAPSTGVPTPTLAHDSPEVRPLSPRKDNKRASISADILLPSLRKRFSWEASGAERVHSPADSKSSTPAPASASSPFPAPTLAAADGDRKDMSDPEPKSLAILPAVELAAQPPHSSPVSPGGVADGGGSAMTQPQPAETTTTSVSNIVHSVSAVSSAPSGTHLAALEPPSPVSVLSDDLRAATPGTKAAAMPSMLTLAEEKSQVETSTSPIIAPPVEEHPAFSKRSSSTPSGADRSKTPTPVPIFVGAAPPPSSQQQQPPLSPTSVKIVPFKEIMALPTPSERIERMSETRQVFARIDSGLDNWLLVMTQQPEHAGATWSLRDNLYNSGLGQGRAGVGADAVPGGTLHSPAQPQPYYQQYLNASNPNLLAGVSSGTGAAGSGSTPPPQPGGLARPPSGMMMHPSQFLASDFRHQSGQVAGKGKELLRTAGKAGKGLFSKGKNKLRAAGAGEKTFF